MARDHPQTVAAVGQAIPQLDAFAAWLRSRLPQAHGDYAQAATGDGGAVLTVPDIACAQFAGTAADCGQSGITDQRSEFAAENFIAEAQFAAAAGVVAEVESASGAFIAKDSYAGLSGESVAGKLGGKSIGRDKEMGETERLIELGCGQIAGA